MKIKISEHFYRHEFACQCGCGLDTIDAETLQLCELVRSLNGNKPITPRSGHRCKKHNADVGGSKRSLHLTGRAVDLPVDDPDAVYRALHERYARYYGFGVYGDFIHIDTRSGRPARWRG